MNEIEELKRRLAEVEEHKERWVSQTYSNAKDRDAALAEVKELKAKLDLSRSDLEKAKQVGLRASEAQLNAMDELIALRQTNNFLLQSDRAAQMSKGDLFKIAYEGKPTNAQVEALARAMYESPDPDGDTHEWERLGGWNKDARRLEARAAFAHSGTPKPADNEPNADIVLAGLEERNEPIHARMLDEYIRGYCEANGTSPSSVSYSRTGFRYALEAMRKMLEPAAAETLEQLAEIGLTAYYASAPDNCRRKFSEISEASQQDTLAQTAAILRAAQAYVEFEYDEIISALKHANEGRGDGEWHNRMRDFMNSRIRYRVALPETPKGLPSAEELAMGIDWKSFCCNATSGEPCTLGCDKAREFVAQHILTALRPWLHEPTGWELDVTAEEIMQACTTRLDGYQAVLDLCRSRIHPTFGCAECAKMKEQRKHPTRAELMETIHDLGFSTLPSHQITGIVDALLAALEGE